MMDEDLIDTAIFELLGTMQEKREENSDIGMVGIAYDAEADELLVLELADENITMPPVQPKPESSAVPGLWRWNRYPEMVEELRQACAEKTYQYCAIACAGRAVLGKDPDNILPALYCYIEIADSAEDLVAIPDAEMEFLLAKISDPAPMIMSQQQSAGDGDTGD
jgi:hypothetical protein